MRRKQRALDEAESWEILRRHRTITLATTTPEGEPVLRELNFALVDDLVVFHGALVGEKVQCLGRRAVAQVSEDIVDIPSYFTNPRNACPATTLYESVQVKGLLIEVTSLEAKARLLQEFMEQQQPEGGHSPLVPSDPEYAVELKTVRVFGIRVESIQGKRSLAQDKPRETAAVLAERLWQRGRPRDLAALERIVALSPEACPEFLRLGESLQLALTPTPHLASQAAELLRDTYWRSGDTDERIKESQLCSDIWLGAVTPEGRLVGLVRGLSDRTHRVLLMDVFVDASRRGRGIGRRLLELFLCHPLVREARHVELRTRDKAHFYEHFGFVAHAPSMTTMRLDDAARRVPLP